MSKDEIGLDAWGENIEMQVLKYNEKAIEEGERIIIAAWVDADEEAYSEYIEMCKEIEECKQSDTK